MRTNRSSAAALVITSTGSNACSHQGSPGIHAAPDSCLFLDKSLQKTPQYKQHNANQGLIPCTKFLHPYATNYTRQRRVPGVNDRLDSIRAAHEREGKGSSQRVEDYLEVIAELVEQRGYATTIDISRYMNVSAPSVTKMLQRLNDMNYLQYKKYHGVKFTSKGSRLAEGIRQKHSTLLEFFEILGVDHDIANRDAEGIEHHLSPKTIRQLRKFIAFLKSNQAIMGMIRNLE